MPSQFRADEATGALTTEARCGLHWPQSLCPFRQEREQLMSRHQEERGKERKGPALTDKTL